MEEGSKVKNGIVSVKDGKVVIYVRVSKSRSDQTSLASQEAECRRWAEQQGWEVVAVFIENGKSAYKKNVKRPEFDRAMQMIETKKASVFLVWKLDRFYRSGTEFNAAWSRIDQAGGLFASVMEPWIDTTTATGRWQLSGIAYQAEIESENRSQRTTSWNNGNLTLEGGAYVPGGSVRPYGFDRTAKGVLTINDDEAAIIKEAAKRIIKGDSVRTVLRDLSPTSTRTTSNGQPIPMSARGLRHVLTNPTTFGLRRTPTGSVVKGCWSPILSSDQYGKLQALFSDPSRRTATTNEVQHLMSGIIECGKCGKNVGVRKWKMNANSRNHHGSEGYRYTCECGNSIDEANANAVVLNRMWEVVTPEVWSMWKVKGHGHDPKVIEEIQAQREQLDMMFLQGKFKSNPARYETMNEALEQQEAMALSNDPLDLPDVDDIEAGWEDLSVIDQRKVIKQAFEVIKLNPANGTRNPLKRMEVK